MKTIKELKVEIETTRASIRKRKTKNQFEVWNLAKKAKVAEFESRRLALQSLRGFDVNLFKIVYKN